MIRRAPAVRARFAWHRVGGMMLRHLYTLKGSGPRILELVYWPFIQMLIWGFITVFFRQHSSWVAEAVAVLISAVLLWDVLFRSNLGFSLTFLEEIWARNLAQLFVSPLRPMELVISLMVMSLIRTIISVSPAAILALPIFDVWVFALGPPLLLLFANILIMGWCIGLLASSLVLRLGQGAEGMVWGMVFLVAPISGIYYPISVLPEWIQPLSWALPSAHVFEGMRAVLFGQAFPWDHLISGAALNGAYLLLTGMLFLKTFEVARDKGLLLQQGE